MILTDARRRVVSAAAVVTVPVVLAVLAIVNPGFPLARVDLNDGAVWVTSTSALTLGRLNSQVEELNGGLVASGSRFDVLQDAADVLLVEPGTVAVVDPASVTLTAQVPVPTGAQTVMGAGTVAVMDADGRVWVRAFAEVGALQVTSDPPDLELGAGTRVAVTASGAVLAVAGGTGDVARVELVEGAARTSEVGSLGGGVDTLTSVGEEPVGLQGSTLRTLRASVELGGADLTVQQPGPADDHVYVASSTALLEVPLDGGDVVEHRTAGSGRPAAPVSLDGCVHAAWASATGSYLRLCDDEDPEPLDLEGMTSSDALTFRVNRHVVVLNDTLQGRLWMPLEDAALREPNWSDIVPEEQPDDEQEESDGSETTQQLVTECGTQVAAPTAADDEFGVRVGRSTTLPVIDNDSSSDCGILAISQFDPLPESFGRIEAIYGGRALQLTVADGASGSATFTYTITDGRGTSAPSTAQVQLTVRDASTNSAPVQLRTGSVRVEAGAQADYSALADFADPDGDDLVLVGATADAGVARFRQDGTLTYQADGGSLGRTTVRVVVSDGQVTSEGVIEVDVRAPGSLAPQIDPVHAVTYVDQPVLLQPLLAVRSSSGEPARLAGVDEVAGATITSDLVAGTFTFSAARPGSYYVPFVVAAAPQQAAGLARIDVLEWPSEVAPPVAVRDQASLPAGGEVTIDPLANDSDPAGSVLVLQSVDVPADSGLRIAILAHQLVQISSTRVLDAPVVVPYVVSNGTASAVGEITVRSVPPSASTQPPVVENVEVSVRTGGVVTIPVLDGAYDPDGDALTLVPELAEPLGDGQGLLFVSGDVLRYQAPATPITARATFTVRDATGNVTAATVTVRVHESDASTKSPPRPRDLTARAFQGDTIRIPVPLVGIDVDGDGVTLLGVDVAPLKGRIVAVGADYLEYEAFAGETGTDTFTYAVEDWVGQRAVATIRVGISPYPSSASQVVARDDAVTVGLGQSVEVRVLANDVDPSGGELSLDPTLELAPGIDARVEGRRIIVLAPAAPALLQIAYTATNDRGGQDTAVLTVTVSDDEPVLPPVARDVVVPPIDTLGLESVAVDVLAVAQNPSGPLSDLAVSVPASAADVANVTPDGTVVVTLVDHAQMVPYLLTNTAPKAGGVSTYAFISVPALGFFPPTARPKAAALRVASGTPLVIPLAEQVQVAPGRTARIANAATVTATNSDGSSLVVDEETLTFTSTPGYAGPASITVQVTDRTDAGDATGRSATITLSVTVYAVDDYPPEFDPAVIELAPGEAAADVDLRVFTRGPEGEDEDAPRYGYQLTSAVPAGFTATLTGSVLTVSAARSTPKGTRGALAVTIGYGLSGSLPVQVDLRVTASTRQTARVVDKVVTTGVQGRDSVVDVLADAYNPFPETPLTIIGVTVETPGSGTASVAAGSVTVRPGADFVGQMVVRYRVRDATGDADREVDGRVTVVVRGQPDTPRAPRVVEVRDRTVVLAWDAPDNRGEVIIGYRVTAISASGSVVRACPSTSCTFDGLTNDVEYTFTVAAQNAVDWSETSPASSPAVRPDAVPEAPGAPSLTRGDRSLTASWSAPASPGSPAARYDVSITPAPASGPATVSTTSTSYAFEGLVNGTAYTVRVRAYNRLPTPGPWSESSQPVTPAGLPEAPVVTAQRVETALGGQISVSWLKPSGNGDEDLTYALDVSGGPGTCVFSSGDPSSTSCVFGGATNGVAYTFSVRARNDVGTGPAGTFTTSTYGVPGAVGAPSAVSVDGAGSVELTWSPPADDGGSLVNRYLVLTVGGAQVEVGAGVTSTAITGLTGGASYQFAVQACNVAGCSGVWSVASASVSVSTVPGAVTDLALGDPELDPQRRPERITATWAAPSDWGGGPDRGYEYRFFVEGQGYLTAWAATSEPTATTKLEGSWFAAYGATPTEVRIEVRAANGHATGEVAQASTSLSRASVPGPVEGLALELRWATVLEATWQPLDPAQNGGLAVTYEVQFHRSGVVTGWVRCETPTGANPSCSGTIADYTVDATGPGSSPVTVDVRASNAAGTGETTSVTWSPLP